MVFVNHGENTVCDSFVTHLEALGYKAYAPFSGAEFDLANGVFLAVPLESRWPRRKPRQAAYPTPSSICWT